MIDGKWCLNSVWLGTSSSHDSMAGWHGGRLFGLHKDTPFLFNLVRIATRNKPSNKPVIKTEFLQWLGRLFWSKVHPCSLLYFSISSFPIVRIQNRTFAHIFRVFQHISKLKMVVEANPLDYNLESTFDPWLKHVLMQHWGTFLCDWPWARQIMPSKIFKIIFDFFDNIVLCPAIYLFRRLNIRLIKVWL